MAPRPGAESSSAEPVGAGEAVADGAVDAEARELLMDPDAAEALELLEGYDGGEDAGPPKRWFDEDEEPEGDEDEQPQDEEEREAEEAAAAEAEAEAEAAAEEAEMAIADAFSRLDRHAPQRRLLPPRCSPFGLVEAVS